MKAKKMFAKVLRELTVEVHANAVAGEQETQAVYKEKTELKEEIARLESDKVYLEDHGANDYHRIANLEAKLKEQEQKTYQPPTGMIEIPLDRMANYISGLSTALAISDRRAVAIILVDIFGDRKVMAIKTYRSIFNVGLKKGKEAIDAASLK